MMRTLRNTLLAAMMAASLPATSGHAADWTITTIDNGPFLGGWVSLALDSQDRPHVAYYFGSTIVFETGTLRRAWRPVGSWVLETIDNGASVGQYCSLILDDQDRPIVSYYDNFEFNRDLKLAWWDPMGGWAHTAIDTAGATGQHTSLALRDDGLLSVAYFDVDEANLRAGRADVDSARQVAPPPGAWAFETLDVTGTVGQFTSLVFNQSGGEVLTYYDASLGDLVAQRFVPEADYWFRSRIDIPGDVGRFTDSAFDTWGFAHVTYYDAGNGQLKYAAGKNGRSWYSETIPAAFDAGRPSAVALTPWQNVEVVFRDDRGWLLLARKFTAFDWVIEEIDTTGTVGEALDFAVDSAGNRHVVYYDETNRRLRYATAAGDPPIVGVPDGAPPAPGGLRLGQNAPNPVGPLTWIPLALEVGGPVRLEVFDVTGRLVAAPHVGPLAAGEHRIPWDGVDASGRRLPAGVYLYRALGEAGGSETRKLVLAR
jgi:hypothetical protein